MEQLPVDTLVILGPTACGKTALAVRLARHLGAEIVSADSRQVYRGMDLGTGKDLAEYGEVPHHLIDLVEPGTAFSLFDFQQRCHAALDAIRQRGRLPLLVGGTGLYLDAVLRGYQLVPVAENPGLRAELASLDDAALAARLRSLRPSQHNTTDLLQRERLLRAIEIAEGERLLPPPPTPALRPLIFGIDLPAELLRQRIALRLRQRLEAGMLEEVTRLLTQGVDPAWLDQCGLEYRWLLRHLQGNCSREELERGLAQDIGRFAKRQRTWFRRMQRQGTVIHWLDGTGDVEAQALQVFPLGVTGFP